VKPRHPQPFVLDPIFVAARCAPMLSEEDEQRLARQAAAGSQASFRTLLKCHLRLVLAIAHEFRAYGLPLEDLAGEGMLGLVEAARRYDPERGVRLAVYAAWWIRAYIRRYTISNRRIVRTPSSRNGRKLLAGLRRAQREIAQATGEQPNAESVAKALGVSVHDVEEMEGALSGRDVPCGFDALGGGIDLPADDPTPEVLVAEREAAGHATNAVGHALAKLSDRERYIVERRHLTEANASLASIGRDMGLSRERVRQLEHEAHSKMRAAVASFA